MYPVQEGEVQRDARPGISAVLVAHTDVADLEGVVLDLAAVLDGLVNEHFEIILVELAASRPLADALAGLRMRHPDLPLHLLEGAHAGDPAALAAGFAAATYDLILVTTGDGQFEIRESNHLFEAVEHGADLAIGYRAPRADGLVRRAQGWAWNALVRLLFGRTARDVDCPIKLFRRSVWLGLGLQVSPRTPIPIFNAEFVVRARRLGFLVVEVPVSHHRPRGATLRGAAGAAEVGRVLADLLMLRRSLNRSVSAADSAVGRMPSGRQPA